jgi:hypothetical protein
MIKIPESSLVKELHVIEEKLTEDGADHPAISLEYDQRHCRAWKSLTKDAHAALEFLLASLEAGATDTLARAGLSSEDRQFAAGQLNILYQIQASVHKYTTLTPKLEDYQQEFGDPDAIEGGGDSIEY